MKIYDLIKLSAANLWKRKLRTFLTMLGVAIGTTSIVVMVSLGVGLKATQEEEIAGWMDLTTIEVYNWSGKEGVVLNEKTLEAISKIEHVKATTPQLYVEASQWNESYIPNYSLKNGRYTFSGSLIAVDLSMLEELGYELKEGSFSKDNPNGLIYYGEFAPYQFRDLSRDENGNNMYDENGNLKAYPFNPLTKNTHFYVNYNQQEVNQLGEYVYKTYEDDLPDYKLKTPGIIKDDGKGSTAYNAFIDYHFYFEMLDKYAKINGLKAEKDHTFNEILVKADDQKNVRDIEKAIQDMGFDTYSATQILDSVNEMMQTVELVLGALGAVSMIVAAIGIANTMIMSIYERTREIGVMKVIGCKLSDIRAMFLFEAAGIGLLGGIVGLVVSHLLSIGVNVVMANMQGQTYNISRIPLWLDLVGFVFSTFVGIISGISPANRAVKISALSAIRQD